MEHSKVEVGCIEDAVQSADVQDLNDLQLALVGGGSGDVVFH
jgi:hypothetical protein